MANDLEEDPGSIPEEIHSCCLGVLQGIRKIESIQFCNEKLGIFFMLYSMYGIKSIQLCIIRKGGSLLAYYF